MDDFWSIATPALAALAGAVFGSFVSIWSVVRNIKHQSIIQERQKWRDQVRQLVPELVTTLSRRERRTTRDSIFLRLNPYDDRDQKVMHSIDHYIAEPTRGNGQLLVREFQDLLKRDWEKAKIEASRIPVGATWRADWKVDGQRRKSEGHAA